MNENIQYVNNQTSQPTILDVKRIASELNLRVCEHPLDGGILVTRAAQINPTQDAFAETISLVRDLDVVGILRAEYSDVYNIDGTINMRICKVRVLFK